MYTYGIEYIYTRNEKSETFPGSNAGIECLKTVKRKSGDKRRRRTKLEKIVSFF